MIRPITAFFAMALICLPGIAHALCEGRVLFEDDFDDNLTGWASMAEHEHIEGGRYLITPDKEGSFASLAPTYFFDEERICIELSFETVTDLSHDAGIAFWGEDYDNYYTFQIGRSPARDHEIALYRRVDGRWFRIYHGVSDAFEVGPGKANTLHVDIDGSIVSTYVNRIPAVKFRAQAPELKHRIGVYAETDRQGGTIAFDRITVTIPDL